MEFELLMVGDRPVVLGEGTFGVAFLAKNIFTNKFVTIKLFKRKDKLTLKCILKEVGFQMVIDKESKFLSRVSFTPKILVLLIFT